MRMAQGSLWMIVPPFHLNPRIRPLIRTKAMVITGTANIHQSINITLSWLIRALEGSKSSLSNLVRMQTQFRAESIRGKWAWTWWKPVEAIVIHPSERHHAHPQRPQASTLHLPWASLRSQQKWCMSYQSTRRINRQKLQSPHSQTSMRQMLICAVTRQMKTSWDCSMCKMRRNTSKQLMQPLLKKTKTVRLFQRLKFQRVLWRLQWLSLDLRRNQVAFKGLRVRSSQPGEAEERERLRLIKTLIRS